MPIGVGIKNTDTEIRDGVLSDATKIAGARIDEAISAPKTLTAAERTAIQAMILSDANPFLGARIDAAISSRSSHAAADVWSVIARTLTTHAFPFTNPAAALDLSNVRDASYEIVKSGGTGDAEAIKTETDKLKGGEHTGTVSAGTAAKTLIKEITTTSRIEIKSIWLDLTNLVTAGATIELEHKIDGTNYKVFETDSWALTDDDGVLITGFTINNGFKISITGGEAAGVNIPYNIIYQTME